MMTLLTYSDVCLRIPTYADVEYGHEVDWWALGVLVWEMITGMPTYADVC